MKRLLFFFLLLVTSLLTAPVICGQQSGSVTSKFDFIPGEKVIFFDDFSAESIGDFPALWLTNGSGEIVTVADHQGKWFQITKGGYYMPDVSIDMVDNYTIEFDIIPLNIINSETIIGINFFLLSGSLSEPGYGSQPGQAGFRLQPDYESVFWNNWSEAKEWQGDKGSALYTFKASEKYHISIWVQKQRVRIYSNENKILDLPRGLQANYKHNLFRIETNDDTNPVISNFRIAAGLPDMRNKLLTEGKIVSYGIYFDINSDKLKPESFATLKEIAAVLTENPDVRVQIAGHTDADGDNALNLDLSKRRSISVKNELVKSFGIDAGRLETDGKGETSPVAPNDSAVNKAKNRRVEFIKL